MRHGCLQGSIANPFTWNMEMDELLGEFISMIECAAYASDLLLHIEGSTRLKPVRLNVNS